MQSVLVSGPKSYIIIGAKTTFNIIKWYQIRAQNAAYLIDKIASIWETSDFNKSVAVV